MKRTVEYTLTRTRHGTPLAILESPLGSGQEIEPRALRALALALLDIADAADRQDLAAVAFHDSKGSFDF